MPHAGLIEAMNPWPRLKPVGKSCPDCTVFCLTNKTNQCSNVENSIGGNGLFMHFCDSNHEKKFIKEIGRAHV